MRASDEGDELPDADQQEFLQVFTEHSRRIYGYILTLTMNHADADEIFQTTSVVLWRKFGQFDASAGTFFAWACRIAHLEVLHLRRRKRHTLMLCDEVLELLLDAAAKRSDELPRREEALESCLELLTPQDRRLIEERYFNSRPPKEIARLLDRSTHAVYRSLARIHGILLRCVARKLAREGL